ncbi:hypothetical protein [Fructobacillus tropaeoli]|uniref:Uncharacterized protein n=1 Tax=Fructobacillus tropaeoli TaxID=709323 RepID=A0A3F3GYY7_9LACO|nr:hypothetical protein [Fructobacillus tropaeoli]GAP03784.1 hypothetical protein FTRO_0013310 [Fructobacillus tropaeoli]
MQSFLEVKSDIQKKQRNSKKWFFSLYIPLLFLSILSIPSYGIININWIFPVLLVEDVLAFFMFLFFHRIDQIIKKENEIIDIPNKIQVDEWFSQNKKLIANYILSPILFPKRKAYYPWGIINKDDCYHIIFINFSKKNVLLILTIQKSEITQYDEANTIENLIYTIQKKVQRLQQPVRKQFYASTSLLK